jgi:hypothetical protein
MNSNRIGPRSTDSISRALFFCNSPQSKVLFGGLLGAGPTGIQTTLVEKERKCLAQGPEAKAGSQETKTVKYMRS